MIHICWLILAFTAMLVSTASADLAKLDPRARAALARVRDAAANPSRLGAEAVAGHERDLDVFVQGEVTRAELEALGARVRTALPGIFTAFVPEAAVERVAAHARVASIRGAAPVEPELSASVPSTGAHLVRAAGPGFAGRNGAGVIVGDVDSGVDHDHGDFEDLAGNTRFVGIWDQTGSGTPPAGFAYGAECTPAQIDAGLCTQFDNSGHGTHVMGIAAGDGSATGGSVPAHTYAGMAPMADLVMVKTNFTTTGVIDGVSYVFDRATALGRPAVVNLSLGSHYGPHDGTSAFESALTALGGPGRIVCKSAGNERGQARHAEAFAAGAGTNVTMGVTGSFAGAQIAIDGYYESTENVRVSVTTPNGTVIGPIARGAVNASYPGASTPNGVVYLENGFTPTTGGDHEVYFEVAVGAGQNMNGTWTFTFIPFALGPASGEVDLWRYFNSTGTTASFVIGNQPLEELISEPGNSEGVITTAAWTTTQSWIGCNGTSAMFGGTPAPGNLATFSSPGPTRDGRQKPDLAAPGVAIGSTRSFDVFLTCPPSGASALLADGLNHVMNQGTSMAAPHTTGAVALLLQNDPALTPAEAKAYLFGQAATDAFTGATWNRDWGHGKLQVGDLVDPVATVQYPNGGEDLTVGTAVSLSWNATDALGGVTSVDVELSRAGAGGPFEVVAAALPNTGSLAWTVTGPVTPSAYLRVTARDGNGNDGADLSDASWMIIPGVMDAPELAPIRFALGTLAPNPSRGATRIAYDVPREAHVSLRVLDVQGREVAVLARGTHRAGRHEAEWNGRRDGVAAAPGLYFVSLETPAGTWTRRLALAR